MKLILAGIAAIFALWGAEGIFQLGAGGNYALKSGDKEVSLQAYRDELNMRFNALRQVMGGSFTPEMAKRLGIQQQVVSDLRTGLLIELEAEDMGLKIPESEILKAMRETNAFKGADGSFDKASFEQALRNAGISEQRYIESLSKETLSKLVLQNFSEYLPDLKTTAERLYRSRNEARDITFYRFTPRVNEAEIGEPDTRALEDYHKAYGEQFRRPEFRKFAWLTINKAAIAIGIDVSEENLKTLYEERLDSFTMPEQREVSQLLYETRDEAEQALAELRQDKSFAETVKKFPPQNEMLSLGVVKGDALPEEARDIVFGLEKGKPSPAIETAFGWHVFRVEAINAEQVREFASVKDVLKNELLNEQMEDAVYDITVELEDSLSAGIPLKEAAQELGLETASTGWVNAQGKDQSGANTALPQEPKNFLNEGFKLSDETDSALLEKGKDAYVFLAIDERQESYIPAIADLGDQVTKAWKAKQKRDAQREKSITLAAAAAKDSSKLGSDMFRAINAKKVKREGALPESVSKALTELPPGLKQEAFSQASGSVTGAYVLNPEKGEYVLAKVGQIHRLPETLADDEKTKTAIKNIEAELRKQYSEDLMALYIQHLADKYPVEVNQAAIAQLTR